MPPLIVRLIITVVAVIAAIFGYLNSVYWRGAAYDIRTGNGVSGASVVLLTGDRVISVSTTDANGDFDLKLGWATDPGHRVMLCKAGSEPSPLFERPSRFRKRINGRVRYAILPANPAFEGPDVKRLRSILPSACQ